MTSGRGMCERFPLPHPPSPIPRRGLVGAVVVAAGRSARMGFDKLWAPLGDRPVLGWSLDVLARCDLVHRLALVAAVGRFEDARRLAVGLPIPAMVVVGGERRRDSVAAGLRAVGDCEWVVVHDGARPFLTPDLVGSGLAAARETGAAVAAVPVRDTIKRVLGSDVVETLPRAELWAIQTPQVFRRDVLDAALAASAEDVTDEATLVERMGGAVRVFAGDTANLKITTPEDLDLARALVARRTGRPV
jgi:2-C-methyl-D-erythritol 4-phosphate cytidylyltransferase